MEDEQCKKIVDTHVQKYGRIDVLVNNASKQIQCSDLGKDCFIDPSAGVLTDWNRN